QRTADGQAEVCRHVVDKVEERPAGYGRRAHSRDGERGGDAHQEAEGGAADNGSQARPPGFVHQGGDGHFQYGKAAAQRGDGQGREKQGAEKVAEGHGGKNARQAVEYQLGSRNDGHVKGKQGGNDGEARQHPHRRVVGGHQQGRRDDIAP